MTEIQKRLKFVKVVITSFMFGRVEVEDPSIAEYGIRIIDGVVHPYVVRKDEVPE